MPIDFQRKRMTFERRTNDVWKKTELFGFASNVTKAEAAIAGFNFQFEGDDHPLHLQFAHVLNISQSGNVVSVEVLYGLRDHSGAPYDDPYSGYVDVLVIVERA